MGPHQCQVQAHPHLYRPTCHGCERLNTSVEKACNVHHPSKTCSPPLLRAGAFANSFRDRKPLLQHIDVSPSAQLRDIEASFAACNDPSQFDLANLRHPNKQGVTAVESFEIFPDADIWANAYDLFRFSERPGERPIDVSCSRSFPSQCF